MKRKNDMIQSNHSVNAKVQKQWEATIDKELKDLAHYKYQ